ncbi:MAG: HAD hydrolase-like protein [Chitinivibrionales bacterium]|nr:HAD hydrolase-like protein [Chitinivibrionales bacterium]
MVSRADMRNWVFFDCFDTLVTVDGLSEHQDYSFLMEKAPVEAGLYDCAEQFRHAYRSWRRRRGTHEPEREVSLAERLRVLFRERADACGIDLDDAVARTVACFCEQYGDRTAPTAGVERMLRHWRGRAHLGVVSNHFIAGVPRRVLEKLGLAHYFDFVLDSAEFGIRKPGHAIYREGLRRAGVPGPSVGDCVFVGDNFELDVRVPVALGMQAVHYAPTAGEYSSTGERIRVVRHWDEFR